MILDEPRLIISEGLEGIISEEQEASKVVFMFESGIMTGDLVSAERTGSDLSVTVKISPDESFSWISLLVTEVANIHIGNLSIRPPGKIKTWKLKDVLTFCVSVDHI